MAQQLCSSLQHLRQAPKGFSQRPAKLFFLKKKILHLQVFCCSAGVDSCHSLDIHSYPQLGQLIPRVLFSLKLQRKTFKCIMIIAVSDHLLQTVRAAGFSRAKRVASKSCNCEANHSSGRINSMHKICVLWKGVSPVLSSLQENKDVVYFVTWATWAEAVCWPSSHCPGEDRGKL